MSDNEKMNINLVKGITVITTVIGNGAMWGPILMGPERVSRLFNGKVMATAAVLSAISSVAAISITNNIKISTAARTLGTGVGLGAAVIGASVVCTGAAIAAVSVMCTVSVASVGTGAYLLGYRLTDFDNS